MKTNSKVTARLRRKQHVRKTVHGTTERPRLSVYRSNKHVYAQVIDDVTGRTLAAASTLCGEIRAEVAGQKPVDAAKRVGALLGQRCKAANVGKVVFDRNGFLYAGRVAAVANGAREAGLDF
jgi:large subunit ribosomal protein L18